MLKAGYNLLNAEVLAGLGYWWAGEPGELRSRLS